MQLPGDGQFFWLRTALADGPGHGATWEWVVHWGEVGLALLGWVPARVSGCSSVWNTPDTVVLEEQGINFVLFILGLAPKGQGPVWGSEVSKLGVCQQTFLMFWVDVRRSADLYP